jgi:hypothetical protein
VNPRPQTTVNLQATSDNKRKVNGRALAGARSRARVRGRAFAGERSAFSLLSVRSAHSPCIIKPMSLLVFYIISNNLIKTRCS